MKLSQLLSLYSQLQWGDNPQQDVKKIEEDSRQVEPGTVFVAIRGTRTDSHQFLADVVRRGAIALIVEDESRVPEDFSGAVAVVSDSRRALDALAARFYGLPAEKLFCVGVTGTNGKTSVTYMVETILNHFGWPTGVMGTVDHHLGEHQWAAQLTTPDALTLQKRLKEFEALKARAVAFEVSSHSLDQHRVDHVPFDVLVFTNLTRDHLDYHSTMEAYFQAKQRLFLEVPLNSSSKEVTAIINSDDPWGRQLTVADRVRRWTFGQKNADITFKTTHMDFDGSEFVVTSPRGTAEVFLPHPGVHNIYNAVAAIGVGLAASVSLQVCSEALKLFAGVPGRLEKIENKKGIKVFVDYAHTDDALRAVLGTLGTIRESLKEERRLITVFGCGGDRDRGKRPLMLRAALQNSDLVFFTSDNPRTEDPNAIIEDGLKGVGEERWGAELRVEPDRRTAIKTALSAAVEGDIVLIAGKGHEDYQVIGQEKIHFSDQEVAKEFFK